MPPESAHGFPVRSSESRGRCGSGGALFWGAAKCSTCHVGILLTDANVRLHATTEIQTNPSYALRSATKMWRTTPLKGSWQHPPYFHDGSAATFADVAERYNSAKALNLSVQQKADLVQYLRSFL
jgi:cytochrome c peroxidase